MHKYYVTLFLFALMSPSAYAGWTQWYDFDDPSVTGDWETLQGLIQQYPGEICETPTGIECREVNGAPLSYSSENVTCSTTEGFYCVNADQSDGQCQDYKVRFLCEEVDPCEALNELYIDEWWAPCETHHDDGRYNAIPVVSGATYQWSIDYGTVNPIGSTGSTSVSVTNNMGGPFTLKVTVTCGGKTYSYSDVFKSYCGQETVPVDSVEAR